MTKRDFYFFEKFNFGNLSFSQIFLFSILFCRNDIEYGKNTSVILQCINISTKCRLFQPPRLKTEGGYKYLVPILLFFKSIYRTLIMG